MIEYNAGPIPELEDIAVRMNGPIKDGPPDLIPGLLPKQGQLVIAGETNVGKSLISLEIIAAVTAGAPLWGDLHPTSRVGKVLYVLGEHYVEVIQRLLQVTKLQVPDTVFLVGPEQLMYDKWLVSRGQPNVQAINKFVKWAKGCELIVFDPFSAFVNGIDVENDNVQMRLVLDTMSLIAQSAEASCIVLAHQGKPTMNQFGQEFKRKSYAIRGASAIEDAATNIFYFDHASNESVERETGGKVYELVCRKYKGQAPPKFTLLRNTETLTHQLISDKPFEAVRKLDLRAKAQRFRDKNPKFTEDTIIDMLATGEGVAPDTIRRWMGLLVD